VAAGKGAGLKQCQTNFGELGKLRLLRLVHNHRSFMPNGHQISIRNGKARRYE